MVLNDLSVRTREVTQLEGHKISTPYQSGSKPCSETQKQHAPASEITADRLHGCVVNDAHRYSQRPREVKMHPFFAQVLRVSKNSSVAYRRRETDRHSVEFPAPGGLLKFGEQLFWSHSCTGWKFAFHALRHEQFDEGAADIDDENSFLHETASVSGTRTIGRDRTIAPCPPWVRASRLCCWASTLRFQAQRTGTTVVAQISSR